MFFKKPSVLGMLQKLNAIIEGHVVLTSGLHTSKYFDADVLYLAPQITLEIADRLAQFFINHNINVVIGPAKGGIIFSQWVAYSLFRFTGRAVLAMYADKHPNRSCFYLDKKFLPLTGLNTLVVDDSLSTGGSLNQVTRLVQEAGGIVQGVGVIWNRGGVTELKSHRVPIIALIIEVIRTWPESECPLCHGTSPEPINSAVGHGKEFLEKREECAD